MTRIITWPWLAFVAGQSIAILLGGWTLWRHRRDLPSVLAAGFLTITALTLTASPVSSMLTPGRPGTVAIVCCHLRDGISGFSGLLLFMLIACEIFAVLVIFSRAGGARRWLQDT